MDKAAVALSGGVDSSFLLYAASKALGQNIVAVTAVSLTRHKEERFRAEQLALKTGVKHILVETNELDLYEVSNNARDRCYYCKKNMLHKIIDLTGNIGIENVLEASTCDDENVFRPGRKAVKELGVRSPLVEAGFSRRDVLEVLQHFDPEISDIPSESCLLTRFPYGERIDREKLTNVMRAEEIIKEMGFSQVRVRTYGNTARIEVSMLEMPKLFEEGISRKIIYKLKTLGYKYITVDLEGFRSGSMDE